MLFGTTNSTDIGILCEIIMIYFLTRDVVTVPFRVAKMNSQYPNMRLELHMSTQRWGSHPKLVFSMGESPTTSFPMGESPTDR